MTRRWFAAMAALVGGGIGASNAHALPVIFTNRALFEAGSVGTPSNVTFDGITTDQFLPFDAGPFTISNVAEASSAVDASPFFFSGEVAVNGSTHLLMNLASTAAAIFDTVTFDFDAPVLAVGFDVNPFDTGGGGADLNELVDFTTNGGDTGQFQMPATDVTEFRGFVATLPFTSVSFSRGTGDDEFTTFGADNITSYIPEPSCIALVAAIGLIGCRGIGRRRAGTAPA